MKTFIHCAQSTFSGCGHKPSAEPLLAVAKQLGVPCERIVLVGDAVVDVQCAAAAGARSVAVLTGVGQAATSLLEADAILPSVAGLVGLMRSWGVHVPGD